MFVLDQEGRIDTLINNAGAGVVRATKAVLAHMRKQGRGHVIAIASVGGLVGQPFNEIYCAAKFRIEGYTQALASYVPPNFGIDFSVVESGGIASEFAAVVMDCVQSEAPPIRMRTSKWGEDFFLH